MSKYKKPLDVNQVNISEQMLSLRNKLADQGYITTLSPNYTLDAQLVGADYLRYSPPVTHLQNATAVIYTVGGNFTVSLFHPKRIEPMHVFLDSDLQWVGPANPEDSYILHYSNLDQLLADHPALYTRDTDFDKEVFLIGRGVGPMSRERFFAAASESRPALETADVEEVTTNPNPEVEAEA